MTAAAWFAASAVFLAVHAWMRPEARAYRAYRRSVAVQRRLCPCGCGHPIHKHWPPTASLPRQRTPEES
ncbi:hypothetical protein ACFC1T_27290 [Kitasatospora sp. NPDC056076]|uniref:hypothetical protein n=1 Tax=Kitasatospora sp. NPDC056076 TaxID=3345703 RepID=UPI0035E1C013